MKPIEFAEQTDILAKDQPQYIPLPVHISKDKCIMTSCWELDKEDLENILETRKLWIQILTFGEVLQPQLPSTTKPEHL